MSGPHVIVQLTASRRLKISVTPATTLSNVLQQACEKFGLSAENYTLRSGKSNIDLSLPFRLSKLTSGAKIDLIKCDRTRGNSVVSVALQLVDGDGSRLIDKFPSSATIWEVLKGFEGSSKDRRLNLTERAQPTMAGGGGGAGRLCYEMPVIQIMQRELSTLEDHQKSLSSLGIGSGTVLLKLKFVLTEIPLEDAMAQINIFLSSGSSTPQPKAATLTAKEEASGESSAAGDTMDGVEPTSQDPEAAAPHAPETEPSQVAAQSEGIPQEVKEASEVAEPAKTIAGPDDRQISVFGPASGNTPEAAKRHIDESNYEMSIKQARQYQDHLKSATVNKRLLTEAQQKQKADAEVERRRNVRQVQIRIRFTDGTAVQSTFKQEDTAEALYHFVGGLLRHAEEPFHLSLPGSQQAIITRDGSSLIVDLGIIISTVVNFNWDTNAGAAAKSDPVLADEFRKQAIEIPVPKEPDSVEVEDDEAPRKLKASMSSDTGGSSSGGVAARVPKWLKFGKK